MCKLTKFTEQIFPCKVNNHLAGQEIVCLLWRMNLYCCVHKYMLPINMLGLQKSLLLPSVVNHNL